MSILLGVAGVASTITVIYLGRKGWHALHRAVGITPGVLTYQDYNTPLSLNTFNWQQLDLTKKHLKVLTDGQLRQLQSIDKKLAIYQEYQQSTEQQKTTIVNEEHFILHKLVYTRLPEILSTHYRFISTATSINKQTTKQNKQNEAIEVLQELLYSIEKRLDELLRQIETQNLQDLRIMRRYLDSQS